MFVVSSSQETLYAVGSCETVWRHKLDFVAILEMKLLRKSDLKFSLNVLFFFIIQ